MEERAMVPAPAFALQSDASVSAFERAPDPCIIVANGAPKSFGRDVLFSKLSAICTEVNLDPKQVQITGKGVRKRFELRFESVARATQFLEGCQDDEGKWIPQSVLDPHGAAMGVHFSFARSSKQEKLDVLTGALGKVLKAVLGEDAGVFAAKRSGVVNVNFVPVASILLPCEKEVTLQWNIEEADRLHLNRSEIADTFKAGGRRKPVKWPS